ncbi:MAG: ribosome recycling factor [Candidatus Shikimatogenerans bostrichidophilus]|nr:MAG: ribosome recycling factor [Candidatus Shikimatogenerans bostrichidophilus]
MINKNYLKKIELEFNKTINFFIYYLSNIHLGIVNTTMLKNIKININNKIYNIFDLSNINVINKITLKITPYEKKNINLIKKSLLKSDIEGTIFNKENDIFFKLSFLTEEKRINLIKKIKIELEKIKITLRKIRNKYNNFITKNKNISKDEKIIIKKEIQKILDIKINYLKKIFKLKKEKILKI